MNNRKILLYGIGGPEKGYAVLEYYCIFEDDISIACIWNQAERMKRLNPCVRKVYVMDNRRGLRRDYQDSIRLNSIESHMIFKDILEREARELLV